MLLHTPCAMSGCQNNFFPAKTQQEEQEAACSYLALQFAPVKSQCLARVDLHTTCMEEHQVKPRFLKNSRNLIMDKSVIASLAEGLSKGTKPCK